MESNKTCSDHNLPYQFICLTREKVIEQKFMCAECKVQNKNKLPRQSIVSIDDVRNTLTEKWGERHASIESLSKQVHGFYTAMGQSLKKQLEEDKKLTLNLLEKLSAYSLPFDIDAQTFNHFLNGRYDQVDVQEISRMLETEKVKKADSVSNKQSQILHILKQQLSKINEKMLSLRYILLGKKLETEFLIPQLENESKIGTINQWARLGGIFNSRGRMIRSLRLAYRGSDHQFSSQAFNKKCKGVKNFVALVKCENSKIIGGYSTQQVLGKAGDFAVDPSKAGFLFSLSNIKSYSAKGQKVLEYSEESIGPQFGSDLIIADMVTSDLGGLYSAPEGVKAGSIEAKMALMQTETTKLADFEIWKIAF